ncbi:hypothetical protein QLL95_gp0454 [Cotonvirus japonicus]|uniref:Uncharacterized protein n=1 Tax=Cotonvirus japonicus TaxID=2811091 RepID=A0ABM7NU58_9VIRU|nr:hypothetical protein QLL95_gp0454 [Cotonvirus japonicus]BCS83669.1 hypothetical protein [Cotonvirus japonicus]
MKYNMNLSIYFDIEKLIVYMNDYLVEDYIVYFDSDEKPESYCVEKVPEKFTKKYLKIIKYLSDDEYIETPDIFFKPVLENYGYLKSKYLDDTDKKSHYDKYYIKPIIVNSKFYKSKTRNCLLFYIHLLRKDSYDEEYGIQMIGLIDFAKDQFIFCGSEKMCPFLITNKFFYCYDDEGWYYILDEIKPKNLTPKKIFKQLKIRYMDLVNNFMH